VNGPRRGQGCLKEGRRCYIANRQLVDDAIQIRIDAGTKAFHGLHTVMVVHGVVRDLTDGNHHALLMEGLDDQISIDAINPGRIDLAVGQQSETV